MPMQDHEDSVWSYGSVVLGCGNFGGLGGARDFVGKGMEDEAALRSMDEAAETGITLFDTAERYAFGQSEKMIGSWLASRPSRLTERARIATKVGPPWLDGREGRFDLTYIDAVFADSLERLSIDSVDVLYTHAPEDHPLRPTTYEPAGIEATLEALESIRESGRARRLGASNIDAVQLQTAIATADRMGIRGYEVIQNEFNLLNPDGDAAVRAIANEHGMFYTAYSALGSGVLTGKYRRNQPPPAGSLVELGYLDPVDSSLHDALDLLRSAAAERGTTTGAMALAWLIGHPDVAAITTAPSRTRPHLSIVHDARRLSLNDEERAMLASWFRAVVSDT